MTERLEALAAEAQRILQKLEEHPFEQGYVLSREFNEFSTHTTMPSPRRNESC
jgi:hypothetical protein